jgi:hypothetical protein
MPIHTLANVTNVSVGPYVTGGYVSGNITNATYIPTPTPFSGGTAVYTTPWYVAAEPLLILP